MTLYYKYHAHWGDPAKATRRANDPSAAIPSVQDGDVFEECNFCQRNPDTPIFAGIARITFINCNLMNCALPVDSKHKECQVSQCTVTDTEEIINGKVREGTKTEFLRKREHTEFTEQEVKTFLKPFEAQRIKRGGKQRWVEYKDYKMVWGKNGKRWVKKVGVEGGR